MGVQDTFVEESKYLEKWSNKYVEESDFITGCKRKEPQTTREADESTHSEKMSFRSTSASLSTNRLPTTKSLHKYLDSNSNWASHSDMYSDSTDAAKENQAPDKRHCTELEDRTYQCSIEGCNKVFADGRKKNQHLRNVHRAKIINCPYEGCDKLFMPRSLSQHIDRIHKNVQVQCSFCERWISKYDTSKHKKFCKGKHFSRNFRIKKN